MEELNLNNCRDFIVTELQAATFEQLSIEDFPLLKEYLVDQVDDGKITTTEELHKEVQFLISPQGKETLNNILGLFKTSPSK